MNHLNSVLIEGVVVKDAYDIDSAKNSCRFQIVCKRYINTQEGVKEKAHFFTVQAWGFFAQRCQSIALTTRKVRIVGRIEQERRPNMGGKMHYETIIVAEHMEFIPDINKQQENKEQ